MNLFSTRLGAAGQQYVESMSKMRVRLNNSQYNFLQLRLATERPDLFRSWEGSDCGSIEIDGEIAVEIRDWASEKLLSEGFDMNYELNDAGRILTQLEDLFYE
jgi:hypothetical protein